MVKKQVNLLKENKKKGKEPMITKKKKTVFVTSDGSEFLNEAAAEAHESKAAKDRIASRMKNAIMGAIDEPLVDASRMLREIIGYCYSGFDNAHDCVISGDEESLITDTESGVQELADAIVDVYVKNPEAVVSFFGAIYNTLKK
jgi:hypothetical protein